MTPQHELRIGLIGTGWIVRAHAHALQFADGARAAELTDALYRSTREGRRVDLQPRASGTVDARP